MNISGIPIAYEEEFLKKANQKTKDAFQTAKREDHSEHYRSVFKVIAQMDIGSHTNKAVQIEKKTEPINGKEKADYVTKNAKSELDKDARDKEKASAANPDSEKLGRRRSVRKSARASRNISKEKEIHDDNLTSTSKKTKSGAREGRDRRALRSADECETSWRSGSPTRRCRSKISSRRHRSISPSAKSFFVKDQLSAVDNKVVADSRRRARSMSPSAKRLTNLLTDENTSKTATNQTASLRIPGKGAPRKPRQAGLSSSDHGQSSKTSALERSKTRGRQPQRSVSPTPRGRQQKQSEMDVTIQRRRARSNDIQARHGAGPRRRTVKNATRSAYEGLSAKPEEKISSPEDSENEKYIDFMQFVSGNAGRCSAIPYDISSDSENGSQNNDDDDDDASVCSTSSTMSDIVIGKIKNSFGSVRRSMRGITLAVANRPALGERCLSTGSIDSVDIF